MKTHIRPAIVSLAIFTILLGFAYPLAVTGIAQLFFPDKANGSVILRNGKPSGSTLIGQSFDDPKFFWGRLSAVGYVSYAPGSGSSGSNLGPLSPDLTKNVNARIEALGDSRRPIPVDLVTASGSGLDPHISPAAAEYQVPRVAKIRGMTEEALRAIVLKHTQGRDLGILGDPRVNVLTLNIELENGK